jgi:hypothetical protein
MRKTLWIMLAILLVSIGAPNAHADGVYAITFSGTGAPTTSDLLDYNSTSTEFTTPSLQIAYDGKTITLGNDYPMTPPSLYPTDSFTWYSDPLDGVFELVDQSNFTPIVIYSGAISATTAAGVDDVTLTAQTPEPSSVALMLAGIGLLLVMRKRIGQGLPQAS